MEKKIIARCPTRIDFAGGTLDLWPIFNCLSNKATVNASIDLYANVEISFTKNGVFELCSLDQKAHYQGSFEKLAHLKDTELDFLSLFLKHCWNPKDSSIKITTNTGSPKGAGLGGSSCLGVAILSALHRASQLLHPSQKNLSEEDTVAFVQNIESSLIHSPAGIQDYWGGIRGGLNVLTYPMNRTSIQTLRSSFIDKINEKLLICYSGVSRFSGINNWEVYKRFFEKDPQILHAFEALGEQAVLCAEAAFEENLDAFIEASHREWIIRKEMWPKIETEQTQAIDLSAKKMGALFSRVCGAGGGGVMVIFAEPEKHEAIRSAVTQKGGSILDAKLVKTGLEVEIKD